MLSHAYAEPPFRIGATLPDADRARMILAWSAPGVFGGDCLEQRVRVERGASVGSRRSPRCRCIPPLAERSPAMRTIVDVEEEAELQCEWDPLIPFAGARAEPANRRAAGRRPPRSIGAMRS